MNETPDSSLTIVRQWQLDVPPPVTFYEIEWVGSRTRARLRRALEFLPTMLRHC